jgi:hypothetical protein
MGRLTARVAALIVWLALLFNVERLDITTTNTIDLPSSLYVTALVVALAGLLPIFQRRPVFVLIALGIALFAIGLAVTSPARIWAGDHKYRTLAGLLLLAVTAVLAHCAGRVLAEFRQAVEMLTFSQRESRVRQLHDAEETVQIELLDCRRKQRPLSLVMLQADSSTLDAMMHRLVHDIQRAMMQRYVVAMAAGVLARFLRRTDVIIQHTKPGRLIFVAPETSEPQAIALGQRMVDVARQQLGVAAQFSVAAFPEQALTFEELLNVAEQRLRERPNGQPSVTTPEDELAQIIGQRAHEQREQPIRPKAETTHGD